MDDRPDRGELALPRDLDVADAERALDDACEHLARAIVTTGAQRRDALQHAAMRAAWAGRMLSDLAEEDEPG